MVNIITFVLHVSRKLPLHLFGEQSEPTYIVVSSLHLIVEPLLPVHVSLVSD